MAMRAHTEWKGGATMVMLIDHRINCGSTNAVPACPREELVRRR